MDISIGNVIIIIGLIIAGAVMIWQFVTANQPPESDESYWHDDVDNTEDSIEETEEFLRRMERLSKREDDEKKK